MTDELLSALKLVKAECEKHYNVMFTKCEECPMYNANGKCGLEDTPKYWRLEKREVYF